MKKFYKLKVSLKIIARSIFNGLFYIRKKNLKVYMGQNVLLRGCSVKQSGEGNSLFIEDGVVLISCQFSLFGKNNNVIIHKNSRLNDITFWTEDNNNLIEIGCFTSMEGQSQLAACEGTSITIGNDCMFSHQVNLVTTDSHAIENFEGKRINPAKDIKIGNHVWIGQKTLVLKGSRVADNSIVGAYSLVNKDLEDANCIYVGQPAHKVKDCINWNRER